MLSPKLDETPKTEISKALQISSDSLTNIISSDIVDRYFKERKSLENCLEHKKIYNYEISKLMIKRKLFMKMYCCIVPFPGVNKPFSLLISRK